MRYAPDLENELMKEVCLFDKNAVPSNFLFVWRFASDCGYVSGKLPEPSFWASAPQLTAEAHLAVAKSSISASAMQAPKAPKAKFDLPDPEFTDDDSASGFAPTKMFTK
jgi:hypothetical protein